MNSSEQSGDLGVLDATIAVCDDNIKRHGRLAIISMVSGVVLLVAIVVFAGYYANLTGYVKDKERFELLSDLQEKRRALIEIGRDTISRRIEKDEERAKEAAKALESAQTKFDEYDAVPLLSQELIFGVVALSAVIISVFTALYRFHQKEMTKNEHYKLGFLRIRIAANNAEQEGFKNEVRSALTLNAFSIPSDGFLGRKEKTIESPLPGHPASELATGIVNKIFEQVEVVLKPKEQVMKSP